MRGERRSRLREAIGDPRSHFYPHDPAQTGPTRSFRLAPPRSRTANIIFPAPAGLRSIYNHASPRQPYEQLHFTPLLCSQPSTPTFLPPHSTVHATATAATCRYPRCVCLSHHPPLSFFHAKPRIPAHNGRSRASARVAALLNANYARNTQET